MDNLIAILKSLNRKERFFLIADALGNVATDGSEDPLVTDSELISMINYGEEEGTIEESERELIERAFAFTDLVVEDVMTPRHKVLSIDGRQTLNEARTHYNNQRIELAGQLPLLLSLLHYLQRHRPGQASS